MFVTVELLYGTWEEGMKRESTILKYIASVQVGDIAIHTESC
jgi:hypothetical protein